MPSFVTEQYDAPEMTENSGPELPSDGGDGDGDGFGEGGDGDGGGGRGGRGDRGGGGGTDVPQIVKPDPVPERSVYHNIVSPALKRTPSGPLVPL